MSNLKSEWTTRGLNLEWILVVLLSGCASWGEAPSTAVRDTPPSGSTQEAVAKPRDAPGNSARPQPPKETTEPVVSEPLDDRAARIEALLADVYSPGEPGASVIVTEWGRVVYRGARGMANLELGVPLAPNMVFRLGSMTKQFTAAAILLLEEQGKLSVEDPITDYLPDYPVHGHRITLEHLLTHTSGIFSFTAIPRDRLSEFRRDLTPAALIDEFKREEMEFAPGEGFSYGNSGYVLLGAIIEKVSGLSYAEFLKRHIFDPLRLGHTHYGGHQLIPRRVAGYRWERGGYVNARYLSMTQPYAAGALLSNVDDLALWNAALDSDLLLSEASRQKMFTAHTLADGKSTGYGYGFRVGMLRGSPAISHGGGIFGFATFAIRLPEEGVYVALLQNGSSANPSLAARQIAAIAIGKPFPERRRVSLEPAILERYVGLYRIDDQTTRTVSAEDGRLYTQRTGNLRVEAVPYSENGFFYPNSLTYFEIIGDDQGETRMLTYHNGSDMPEEATRTKSDGHRDGSSGASEE